MIARGARYPHKERLPPGCELPTRGVLFRGYIDGYRFTIVTDHHSLRWLFSLKDFTRRLARWAYKLQVMDCEIRYRKGANNLVPDALSRVLEDAEKYTEDLCLLERVETGDKWYHRRLKHVQEHPES